MPINNHLYKNSNDQIIIKAIGIEKKNYRKHFWGGETDQGHFSFPPHLHPRRREDIVCFGPSCKIDGN